MARVSVFIPVYNNDRYIAEAILSVINQTYHDWELIIVDDASSDRSYEISKVFGEKDSRIEVYRNEVNLGMVNNWNKGISLCHSEFFIKLDADDTWEPMMLERSMQVMNAHADVALVFTQYINIDEAGKAMNNPLQELPGFAKDRPFSCVPLVKLGSDRMFQFPILRQGLSLTRRKVFDEIGVYRFLITPETQASSDTEFYFRVGCNHLIYCMNEVLYHYRIHSCSISHTDADKHLQHQKMFEAKIVINDYYRSQSKISVKEWRSNRADAIFGYQKHQIYQSRKRGQFWLSSFLWIKNMFLFPAKTIRFYTTRLKEKF